jgi:hypothetical protein
MASIINATTLGLQEAGDSTSSGTLNLQANGSTVIALSSAAGTNITGNTMVTGNVTISGNLNVLGYSTYSYINVATEVITQNTVVGGFISSNNGLLVSNNYTGSYTDGVVIEYVSGNGRISAGPADNITFYSGGPGTTAISTMYSNGNFSPSGTAVLSGTSSKFGVSLLTAVETASINAVSAPASTQTLYMNNGSVQYWTANTTQNWTANVTFSSTTSLNTAMSVGQTATITMLTTQGSTSYYSNTIIIDGSSTGVTTYWQGNTAPTQGNAYGLDVYTYAIIKTAAAPATYTVLASQTQF